VSLVGAAHAPSPDVRCGLPGLRSLGGGWRSGILPALATYAGSWGMGNPSRILTREASPRPRLSAWPRRFGIDACAGEQRQGGGWAAARWGVGK